MDHHKQTESSTEYFHVEGNHTFEIRGDFLQEERWKFSMPMGGMGLTSLKKNLDVPHFVNGQILQCHGHCHCGGKGVGCVSEVSLGKGKQRQGAESSNQWNTVLIGGFKQHRGRLPSVVLSSWAQNSHNT